MGDLEAMRLEALRSLGVLDTPSDGAIDRLTTLAAHLFDTPIALVSLVDEDRQWFKAKIGLEADQTARDQAFCAHTITQAPGSVMVVEDATLDPRFAANPLVVGQPAIRFYAGATLSTREGYNLGTLCVIDDKPRPRPEPATLERLQLLARIVVDEFELAQAHRKAEAKRRLLEIAEGMAGMGHWRLDLASGRVEWSDAVYAIHGVTRDTFDPNLDDAVAFYHPEDQVRVRAYIEQAATTGDGFEFQLRLIRSDGVLRHVASRGVCELGDDGRPVAIFGLFQDVTAAVNALAAAQRRSERYRLITENAGDVIARYDFTGRGRFISPAIERLLGYTVFETIGMTVPHMLHPEDRERVMAVFGRMAEGLEQETVQHRTRRKDGGYVWVESNLQLVRSSSAEPLEIVSVSRDISDRKALELELTAARDRAQVQAERARLAEDIGGLGYWRFDLRTRDLDVSPKMFEIYGVPWHERPAIETFNARIHPDEYDWTMARIAERLRTGEADYNVLTRIVRPDGEARTISGSSIIVAGPDGAPSFVMGTVRDITDERAAQLALTESEARYRLIADNARDIIATFDAGGRIRFVSPATRAVLGREPDELLGGRMLDITHPDDRAPMSAYYAKLIAAGPNAIVPTHEFRVQHRDGHWVWLEGQPKLFFDDEGRLVAIQDVGRDVTARKAMEAELVQARAEAEAAAAVKSEFLSNMSHELRTPLTAVLGFSKLIADQQDLSPLTRGFVERVVHAGEALLSTVNDILDFSKLEAGQVEIRPAPCDPCQLLEDALGMFSGLAGEKGLELRLVRAREAPPLVVLAHDRVRQILLNLIGNAVKFTEQGSVTVEMDWDAATEQLQVGVRDTGRGVPAERLSQLFKRFSQVDGSSTRQHGGTGLGLAICKGLAEAMGGEIGVESRLGEGSRFWFTLPAPAAEALPGQEDAEIELLPEGARVLIVDDNAVNRDLVRTLLAAFGAVTSEAADGEAAIRMAAAEPYDVILMDMRMPGMGGVDATRAIRKGVMNGTIPIIAFSADVTEAPLDLFDGVIAKPLQPVEFMSALSRALQQETESHAA